MALSTRELLLIVRAQNQASGALRRVGRDMAALGKHRSLQVQQQKLLLNQQNLMRQRQRALRDLEQVTTGTRAIATQQAQMRLDKARLGIANQQADVLRKQKNLSADIANGMRRSAALRTQQLAVQNQITRKAMQQVAIERNLSSLLRERTRLNRRAGGADKADPSQKGAIGEELSKGRLSRGLLASEMEVLTRRLADYRVQEQLANRKTQDLVNSSTRLGRAFNEAGARAKELDISEKHLAARKRDLALRSNELRSELTSIGQRYMIMNAQQKELSKTIRQVRWEPISTGGKIIQHLGRVTQIAGIVAGAGLGMAANAAAQFNKEATLTATQAGTVSGNFKEVAANATRIEQGLLRMAPRSTSSLQELNQAAYEIFSSTNLGSQGVKGLNQGLKLVDLFSQAAIAGQTDLSKATQAGVTIFNSFGKDIRKMPTILNRMFAAVRFGRFTFEELSASMGQVAPAAVNANQNFDQIAGAMAQISRHIPNVGMMRTGLARALEMLNMPDFVKGMEKMGVAVRNAEGKMRPLNQVIADIVKKNPDLAKGRQTIEEWYKAVTGEGGGGKGRVGTIQGRRALVALIRFNKQYQTILKQTTDAQNSFQRALTAMESTTGVKWEKFINQLKAVALMIGSAVLPEILKIAPHIQHMVDLWQDLDSELRSNIVRWAAISTGILLVGSAFLFVLGPLIRFIALLGRNRILFSGLSVGFLATAAAIAALRGDWNGLNTIIESFFSLTNQGTWGWIAMFGIAAVAATKLTRAIVGVRTAYVASQAVAAGGMAAGGLAGIFAKGRRASNDIKGIRAMQGEGVKLTSALKAAGLSAAAIPVAGWAAAGAMVAAGGAALLWKRHMDGVKRNAQEVRNLELQAQAPVRAAERFADLPNTITAMKQAQIDVKNYDLQIKNLRNSLKSLKGVEREQAQLDLSQAMLNRTRSLQNLNTAYNNVRVTVGAFTDYLARQQIAQARIGEQQQLINNLLQRRAELMKSSGRGEPGGSTVATLTADIVKARAAIARWSGELTTADQKMRAGFNKTITVFQNLNMLPKKIAPQMRNMAFDFQKQLGRLMTPQQLSQFFKFALNLDTAPANNKMVQFMRSWQNKQIRMSADLKIKTGRTGNLTPAEILSQGKGPLRRAAIEVPINMKPALKLPPGFMGGIKVPPITPKGNPAPAKATLNNAFKKPITQPINVKIPNIGRLSQLGTDISAGIQQGMKDATQTVRIKRITDNIMNTYENSFKNSAEISSPSQRFARTVGKPIIDGIIQGILNKEKITRTAALTMDLFNGAFLQKRQMKIEAIGDNREFDPLKLREYEVKYKLAIAKAKKSGKELDDVRVEQARKRVQQMKARQISTSDLIKDMQGQVKAMVQFNTSLARLTKRGAPKGLLSDLRALGIDGLRYIKLLANASPAEFKKLIRAWNQMQGQIRRSQFQSVEDIKAWSAATRQQLQEFKDTAAQKLLDTWNELRDVNRTNFGTLFQGLEGKVGSNFTDALDTWKNQVADYQSQIRDLNTQIAEAHKEAADRLADAIAERRNQLEQAMGTLFAGNFLTSDPGVASKREWGVVLGFDDLFADLQDQVNRFNEWRSTLTSLAAKVPPELAKALEELGPEALANLRTLDTATASQLASYVSTWQQGQSAIANIANKTTVDTSDITARVSTLVSEISRLTDALGALVEPKPLSPDDVINGLNTQIDAFANYQGILEELRKKKLPDELIMQLARMGPEALPYMQALNSMTATQLSSFAQLWSKSQQDINNATNQLMDVQLSMWYSHGANIASALIAGVSSEQQALLKFFRNMFENLLQGKMPTMGATPTGAGIGAGGSSAGVGPSGGGGPQRGYVPMADGGIVMKPFAGMYRGEAGPEAVIPLRNLDRVMSRYSGGGTTSQPTQINMNVHPQASDDFETILRRASWRLRNYLDR